MLQCAGLGITVSLQGALKDAADHAEVLVDKAK